MLVCGPVSSRVECALEELPNIQQIVCSETVIAVLTTSGLVYRISLSADSPVCICFPMCFCFFLSRFVYIVQLWSFVCFIRELFGLIRCCTLDSTSELGTMGRWDLESKFAVQVVANF